MDLLFAYGTLRRGARRSPNPPRPIRDALARAAHLGRGHVRGRLHRMGPYPIMVLSCDARDAVIGDVYRIDPSLWPMLDSYEGGAYVREMAAVTMDDETSVRAYAYFAREQRRLGARIDCGDFLA